MIYLIDIERIDQRYSTQWRKWIPEYFPSSMTISGTDYTSLTKGGFFDFNKTNIYKNEQAIKLATMINDGQIIDGDIFLFYDVWHPGVINLKYMLDIAGIDAKIYGLLHAGSYDKTDILGIKGIGSWAGGFEESIFKACEQVFVASNYHRDMILNHPNRNVDSADISVAGWPYRFDDLGKFESFEKKDVIVFPHRLSPDKQPEIFLELEERLPELTFVRTQDMNLDKDDYHTLLGSSKYIFSAALHENLGIATAEAAVLGCVPILPRRCSYKEMYNKSFLYKSTSNIDDIETHIRKTMKNYVSLRKTLSKDVTKLKDTYFNFEHIVDTITA